MIKFRQIIESLILEDHFQDAFVERYVGSGQVDQSDKKFGGRNKVPSAVWDEILKVSSKTNLSLFLGKAVLWGWINQDKQIQFEDIFKFKDYFKQQSRNPDAYGELRDFNRIRSEADFNRFVDISKKLMDKEVLKTQTKEEGYVTEDEIQKLKSQGIDYLGMADGYQVFYIPRDLKGNEKAWTTYRNILGKSSGGAISICTIGALSYWNDYLGNHGPLFLMYKYSDPDSPYQICYEANQFMDRNDRPLLN